MKQFILEVNSKEDITASAGMIEMNNLVLSDNKVISWEEFQKSVGHSELGDDILKNVSLFIVTVNGDDTSTVYVLKEMKEMVLSALADRDGTKMYTFDQVDKFIEECKAELSVP